MADRVGQQLGNYRLVRLLGRGGFAEVYLGEHTRLGTQAAVKILYTRLGSQDDVESFEKEARTVAHLKHPHIVRVLDYDVDDETPFLVMDYAAGGTLRTRHPKGAILPLPTIISYVKQIADALQYAHNQRLIHRDIKPENMLLGEGGQLLLSDFGTALMAQSSRYQSTQEVIGTVAYMSPEHIHGHPRPASDQYSLGIVVYEWLTGERPFHGSFTEMCTQHMFAPPLPLRERVPTLPPAVEQVVLTALQKDPHRRFARVQAFAHALSAALDRPVDPTLSTPHFVPSMPTVLKETPAHSSPVVSQKTKEQWMKEGNACYARQQYDKAIANYTQALQLDPRYAVAYYNRGLTYDDLEQYDKAIADYDQTLQLDPRYAKAYYSRGNAYYARQQYDKAIADYNQALQLDPRYAKAYYSRGNAYYALRQYDKAIADYDQALQLDFRYANAQRWRQEAYRLLREKP
jgi:serine/threonine protein kinase